jgi:hypothetical protein
LLAVLSITNLSGILMLQKPLRRKFTPSLTCCLGSSVYDPVSLRALRRR